MHLVITVFVFNGQRTKADYWSHSSFSFSSLKYIFMCPCTQTFDLFFSLYNYFLLSFMVVEIIVHGEKWSRSLVNVKEVNKKAEMYVGRLLNLSIFCFMLTDHAQTILLQCFNWLVV